ncbi:MAG: fumarylacetoacetate hydrolase family protein [Gammaproteobacteria bacterium]|nr:fumarylacetoacetate hydrolase family protein [Gammaproteobacteria bacterium]
MKTVTFANKTIIPTKIVCIGLNYVDHIKELNNQVPTQQVLFMKPNSAIGDELVADPKDVIHYEGEVSLLVEGGRYTAVAFGLDLTKRDLQSSLRKQGHPWERAKGFDGAAVFSKFVEFDGDVTGLRLELHINDTLVQSGGYELMINKPEDILTEVQSFTTLNDGDIIMTGTPQGVGPMVAGDRYVGKVFSGDELLVEAEWVVR